MDPWSIILPIAAAAVGAFGRAIVTSLSGYHHERMDDQNEIVTSKESVREWVEKNYVTRNELLSEMRNINNKFEATERLQGERHIENQRRSTAQEAATKDNGEKLDMLVNALLQPDGRRRERPSNPGTR